MTSLIEAARGIAAKRVGAVAAVAAEVAAAELPRDLSITPSDDGVAIEGRGLLRRRVVEARLRWLAAAVAARLT